MAASGGDSKVLNILGGCGSFGTGEFNSHFRLGVQKLALLTMLDAESILSPLLIESRSGNKDDGRGGGGYSSSLALSLASKEYLELSTIISCSSIRFHREASFSLSLV